MAQPEKRMRVLPSLRVGELLENALMRLAARDDSQMFNDADAMHGRTTGHGSLTDR